MPFPKETTAWAEEIKDELIFKLGTLEGKVKLEELLSKKNSRRNIEEALLERKRDLTPEEKKVIAGLLYHGLTYKYGFEESLRTNNWTPWPHEIKEVNCYSQAIVNFVATKACGFNPKLIEFIGIRKEGDTDIGGHSLIVIDVGTKEHPEYWTIDQPHRMYGPITLNMKTVTVTNFDSKKEKNIKKYKFVSTITSEENEIINQVEALRKNPEAALYIGQRIQINELDKWQSEEAIATSWFLKFQPADSLNERGDIISRIILQRPGIKSRGLEYRITLDNENKVKKERIIGSYCEGMVWADFMENIPLIDLELKEIIPLLEGIEEIPLEKRAEFEREIMKQSTSPSEKYKVMINTAKKAYDQSLDREEKEIITTIAAVEALYQYEKGNKNYYLTEQEREREADRINRIDKEFSGYAKFLRELNLRKKTKGKRKEMKFKENALSLINEERRENSRTKEFLALETEEEMLSYIIGHNPLFFYEAIDKLVFYDRKIKGGMKEIQELAKKTFGTKYDQAIFSGYTKIFAEFLGHFAVTFPELTLQEYKDKIIKKIT